MFELPLPRQRFRKSFLPVVMSYSWVALVFVATYYIVTLR